MKLGLVVHELHRSETMLVRDLQTVSERHKAEHEVHYVACDLAAWSRGHVDELTVAGRGLGLRLDDEATDNPGLFADDRTVLSEASGRGAEPGLLLLADLRRLHCRIAGVSVDWELLAQGAQATKQTEFLTLAQRCHPQTLRQLKWSNAMLKTLAPQILAT